MTSGAIDTVTATRKITIALLLVLLPWTTAWSNQTTTERCVTDMSGRRVCIKADKPKIISLSPGSTELLFAAGAGAQVIAVDLHSDYPEAVASLPRVGGYPNINIEAIVGLQPDLVAIWKGGNSPAVVKQLESLGITTFDLDAVTLDGIKQALVLIGEIAGTQAQAKKTIDVFSTRLKTLQTQYAHLSPVPVLFEFWHTPLIVAGNRLAINDVITLCGGRNIYQDITAPTAKISIESVVVRNPQVIIGSDPRGNTPETRQEMFDYWKQWPNLQAVQQQQLFSVTSNLIARPTPRVLEGAEMICKQLQEFRQLKQDPNQTLLVND